MTRVNNIVMKGFKSFANKTELLFGKNFNCVLGPNGSGKSNILDAICFVLGKGSAKGLRVEKATNLIYNGGKKKNPAKEGEVSIFFDNSNGVFPTDEKEVKISRIVRTSGQSIYKINDKKRTRQQILDLLSVARINPDGYNIILQGDIIEFVEMSPEKRRGIVEEVSGISIYEEKRQKAVNELSKVEGKLGEADIILTERKTHLDELKTDRNQALKYRDLEKKQKTLRASLLSMQLQSKSAHLERFDKQMESVKSRTTVLKKKIQEKISAIKKMKDESRTITEEIEKKGEKEQLKIQKQIEELRVSVASNKTRIGSIESEVIKVDERKNQLNTTLSDICEKIELLNKKTIDLEKQKKSEITHRDQMDQRISAFRKKHKIDNMHSLESDIEAVDKKADELGVVVQTLREEQQKLFREKDRLEMQINSIDEKISKVSEIEKEHKSELKILKNKKLEFKKATVELNKLLNDSSSVAAQLGTARTRLVETNDKLARLRSKSGHLNEKMSVNAAVDAILAEKNRMRGIYDTVANLGKVSEKFSVAMEIAAGPRIKSIVVESDEVASKCIKFLKSKQIGVATFLPLNKIKGLHEKSQSVKGAGVHGSAKDLLTFDPKFSKVFSYVFGSTLVVDSIDVARRIGIGTHRMVTLDGDLVETSGAMLGGFRQKQRRLGFHQKEVLKDLEKFEKETDDLTSLVERLEKERSGIDDKVAHLREFKAQLEGEIIKTEKSLHLESSDLESNLKVKGNFGEELEVVDKKIQEIQNKISIQNRELAEHKIKKQRMRSEISELRNPRLVAELNAFEEKRDEIKARIISIEQEQKNNSVQIDTILSPEKENIVKIIKQQEKEEIQFKEELVQIASKISSQEKDLTQKEAAQKDFYAKFKNLFTKRSDLEKRIDELEEETKAKEFAIHDLENKQNTISLEKARIIAEKSAIEKEFEEFKDQELVKNRPMAELERELSSANRSMLSMGAINLRALEVYERVETEYQALLKKKDTLILEKEDVLMMMNEIETKKKELFLQTFDIVNEHFKNIFSQLSTKGEAYMELENSESPFEAGVRINVRITGKKYLDIRSLSGGEKTMTALAFIFAIQENDPASFYVLDEVDASLDKRNSEKLSTLVRKYSDRSQYIVISHNDGVISEADSLYGVSMDQHGVSKVVSLKI